MTASAVNPYIPSSDDHSARRLQSRLAGHLAPIDGLRGIAILLVMLMHETVIKPTSAADSIFCKIASAGWCGVDLFFVISGFLITGILFDARGSRHYFRNFYARRTLRIFPLYYTVTAFLLLGLPLIAHPKTQVYARIAEHQEWFWLYLANIYFAIHDFTGDATDVFWSLAIEEQFYLIWPIMVLCLSRRALMYACVGMVFAALALRAGLVTLGSPANVAYVLTPARMDALAIGSWVALVLRGPGCDWAQVLLIAKRTAAVAGLALLGLVVYRGGLYHLDPVIQVAGYLLLAVFFAATLVLSIGLAEDRLIIRVCSHRFFRTFGRYSYALYLFHVPMRSLVLNVFFDVAEMPTILGSRLPAQAVFYLFTFGLSFLAAYGSWHLLEKHLLLLKKYFPYQPAAEQAGRTSDQALSNTGSFGAGSTTRPTA